MSQAPLTPPMHPGPLGPGPAPAWPKVLGIITVILGSLGALMNIWGIVAPFLFHGFVAATGQNEVGDMLDKWRWWTVTNAAVLALLAVPLIAGGIGLVNHRSRGPRLLLLWSILRIGFALIAAVITWFMAQDQGAAMSTQSKGAMPGGVMALMLTFGVGIQLLMVIALPVFLLFFLNRSSARRLISDWH